MPATGQHVLRLALAMTLLAVGAGGCSSIRVSSQSTAQTMTDRQASILDRDTVSEPTLKALSLTGQTQTGCLAALDTCLAKMRRVPEVDVPSYLGSASELYLAHLQALQAQPVCREAQTDGNIQRVATGIGQPVVAQTPQITAADQARCRQDLAVATLEVIRHAYAYLFAVPHAGGDRLFSSREQQVTAFYNLACARWIEQHFNPAEPPPQPAAALPASVALRPMSPVLVRRPPTALIAANTLNFGGLRTINRRDGLGVEFVALLPATGAEQFGSTVHQSQYVPLTAFMRVAGDSLQAIMKSRQFTVELYDPFQAERLTVLERAYPLAANFSAPYGLWLARTDLNQLAYRHLLGDFGKVDDNRPHLYMLEPFDPAKRVIVLIHGIASSPEAWLSLTNDILGDPLLRRRYQVWQVFYPTNLPILENHYQVRQVIHAAYRQVDPAGQTRASQQSVLIGHSMGGVIARMLVSPTDLTTATLPTLSARERAELKRVPELAERLRLTPLAQVGRAIFVSAPFRGTDYADKWFTKIIRRTMQLPASLSGRVARVLNNGSLSPQLRQQLQASGVLNLENGASDLSPQSRFNQITAGLQIKPGLPYHLIMGNSDPSVPTDQSTDGIVPYTSAHLEGAASETVLEGGHSIQLEPLAALEFRRLLRQHLIELGELPAEPKQLELLDSPLGLSTPEQPVDTRPAVLPSATPH